ncbi:MAG: cell division protein FtsH [Elusimicrobia bacterium RIFOXYA2_FULL_39_19]|nr:MAG: cell division protein FtsH [Elusimicrobia bacterium RIFOXYA2_FULL_39_19]
MKKTNTKGIFIWALVFLGVITVMKLISDVQPKEEMAYSNFKAKIKADKVKEIRIKTETITGTYTSDDDKDVIFETIKVTDSKLTEDLEAHNVKYSGESEHSLLTAIVANIGWILLFFLVWYFMMRQMQGGGKQVFAFGKSKAKLQGVKKTKITFADVAGCTEAKEELQEIIEFLKDPAKFQKLGGKIPKGVILYGAPGTGKTLLAKAVAGEAGVPFFSSSGSEFVEMFVGVGASRVRDLFDQGRKSAPCLLFIDELDAVGRHRFAGIGGGHDEREQTLNQLLVEMDGFDTREGVILIAATNRPDVLDPALMRPGRFDRHVVVPSPDLKGREEILRVHAKDIKLAPEIDFNVIARRTPGFVGADLANLVNEGALLAARRNKTAVEMSELEEAIDRVIAGPERKSRMISEKEKKIVAFHEAGHALVARLIPESDPVHKISIIPRGPALGYTLQLPTEDRFITTRTEITSRITAILGGRIAEIIIFNEITTGSQNDLIKATEIAQKMVCEYGMSTKLGPISLRKREEETFLGRDLVQRDRQHSDNTAQIIDEEVKDIIETAEKRAKMLIEQNIDKLKLLAEKLIEKEVIDADEIEAIIKGETTKQNAEIPGQYAN